MNPEYQLKPADYEVMAMAFEAGILFQEGPMKAAIPLLLSQAPKLHTALQSHHQSEQIIKELFKKPIEELQ